MSRDQSTFSIKGRIVNILVSVGRVVSVVTVEPCHGSVKSDRKCLNKYMCCFLTKLYLQKTGDGPNLTDGLQFAGPWPRK